MIIFNSCGYNKNIKKSDESAVRSCVRRVCSAFTGKVVGFKKFVKIADYAKGIIRTINSLELFGVGLGAVGMVLYKLKDRLFMKCFGSTTTLSASYYGSALASVKATLGGKVVSFLPTVLTVPSLTSAALLGASTYFIIRAVIEAMTIPFFMNFAYDKENSISVRPIQIFKLKGKKGDKKYEVIDYWAISLRRALYELYDLFGNKDKNKGKIYLYYGREKKATNALITRGEILDLGDQAKDFASVSPRKVKVAIAIDKLRRAIFAFPDDLIIGAGKGLLWFGAKGLGFGKGIWYHTSGQFYLKGARKYLKEIALKDVFEDDVNLKFLFEKYFYGRVIKNLQEKDCLMKLYVKLYNEIEKPEYEQKQTEVVQQGPLEVFQTILISAS